MAKVEVTSNFKQVVTPFLRGIVNRQVKDFAYTSSRSFLGKRADVVLRTAIRLTDEKYPLAMQRDEKRRPAYIRSQPHLRDSWKIDRSKNVGTRPQIELINTRPKAEMLIRGLENPSVIRPGKFFFGLKTNNIRATLVYPRGTDGRKFVDKSRTTRAFMPVIRPVPSSQKRVANSQTIAYRAFKSAFASASDRRIRGRTAAERRRS